MDNGLSGWLEKRLAAGGLPGRSVALQFGPRPYDGRHYVAGPADARDAAVLVLLYPHDESWHIPLTLRPTSLPDHGGQISLPGGAIEPGETSREAAIREFHEELGADGLPIEILGRLSPLYVSASNFRVKPWVGVTRQQPHLVANPTEVEEIIEVPLPHLLDPANLGSQQRHTDGISYTAPHFRWQSHRIWGATCLILGELVTLLSEKGQGNHGGCKDR
jgi:8-oxo-dGTP pyrophosphatase MutT (NUDIX family)